MTNEGMFWFSTWFLGAATIVFVSLIGTSYWKDHNTKVVELIQSGVPAVEALCALQDDYGNNPVCIVSATKSN